MKETPLFPAIADAEAQGEPPFEPYLTVPVRVYSDKSLGGAEIKILMALLHILWGQREKRVECYPVNQDLADATGLSLGAVRRALQILETGGYIHRVGDPGARGPARAIQPCFRTWNPPRENVRPPVNKAVGGRAPISTPLLISEQGGARLLAPPCQLVSTPPPISARPLPISLKRKSKEFKTSEDATVLSHPGEQTDQAEVYTERPADQVPAAPVPSPDPIDPAVEAQCLAWLQSTDKRLRRIAELYFRERTSPAAGDPSPPPAIPTPIPQGPPPAPVPSRPAALPPSTSPAHDPAWAALMASGAAPALAMSSRPLQTLSPPQARPRPVTRPEVGTPCRNPTDPRSLARSLPGEGVAAELVDCLSRRWKDRKPATLAFWASAIAEVATGLITADMVSALIADADRREVKYPARQFSKSLGEVLAGARNRPPGPVSKQPPAGGHKVKPPCPYPHYNMNGSPRK